MANEEKRQLRPAWQALLSDAGEFAARLPGGGPRRSSERNWSQAFDAMLADAWDLTGAVVATADRVARMAPGHAAVTKRIRAAEAALLREIKSHLEALDGDDDAVRHDDPRAEILDQLLTDSRRVKAGRSNVELHLRILRSLLPDEARILATMASGERYPLLHLEARGQGGPCPILANACTVGRIAAIHQQNAVCVYIGHLRNLGLVDEGPREDALSDQYALIRNEDYVMRAIEQSRFGPRSVMEMRRTLHISPLGSELWTACRPGDGVSAGAGSSNAYRSAYSGLPPLPRK